MGRDQDRSARIQGLFELALDLAREDRQAFLERECSDDPDLAREVESLLAFAAQTESDGLTTGAFAAQVMLRQAGERVGPYVIVRALGSGAMGDVFLAIEDNPRRQVALKVPRLGSDANTLARFRLESAALARMNHENIARVYAAGEESNQPYMALELVPGATLTSYADQHRLSVASRLSLFIGLCDALEHIHQNGLIHRDLKPGNIVVSEGPRGPSPKVIDFGIAKSLTDPLLAGDGTVGGVLLGTLEYASPEQLADSKSVDTRTDIYSAGVILYELLVGARPFSLRERSFVEFMTAVSRDEAAAPSVTLARRGAEIEVIANARSTNSAWLMGVLRSDLDWIVLKALRKLPAERYATAGELRADIQRYLNREPVRARPPSAAYRARKALMRHRNAVLAGATVLVAVAAGVMATVWQARVANTRLSQLNQVAANLIASVNDIADVPGAMQAKQMLIVSATKTLERIGTSSRDPVLADRLATAYERVGQLRADPYMASLGQTEQGLDDLLHALKLRVSLYRAKPGTAEALNLMKCSYAFAIVIQSKGGGEPDPDSLLHAAVAIGEPIVTRDSTASEVKHVLSMIYNLEAQYQYPVGHWAATLDFLRRAISIRHGLIRESYEGGYSSDPLSLDQLAYAIKDPLEARSDALRDLQIHESYYHQHPFSYRALLDLSWAYRNAAVAMRENGATESAITFYGRVADVRRSMAISDSSDVRSLSLLAEAYNGMVDGFLAGGHADSAQHCARLALDINEAIAARPNAPPWSGDGIWSSRRTLARVSAYLHRSAAADSLYELVCARDTSGGAVYGMMRWRCAIERAQARLDAGDRVGAATTFRSSVRVLEWSESALRRNHADAIPYGDVALSYAHLGQMDVLTMDERIGLLRHAMELPLLEGDPRGPQPRVENELACLLADQGQAEEARQLLRTALNQAGPDPIRATLTANLASLDRKSHTARYDPTRDPYERLYLSAFRRWPVWGESPIPPPSRRVPVQQISSSTSVGGATLTPVACRF